MARNNTFLICDSRPEPTNEVVRSVYLRVTFEKMRELIRPWLPGRLWPETHRSRQFRTILSAPPLPIRYQIYSRPDWSFTNRSQMRKAEPHNLAYLKHFDDGHFQQHLIFAGA